MKKTDEIYLKDIQNSILKIEEYLRDVSYEAFTQDTKTQDAVIRNLEVIGRGSQ
jgi:uncharacterized protein with HEPN domain